MLSAFHYIFHRADIIAKDYEVENLRLVINFSYGFSGGRHDGETELEAAIDELVCKRRQCRGPTALVLPAGNTFLDRLHGVIYDEDFHQGAVSFHWRIQPNDRTPSYLELWFWHGFDPQGYRIELWDPWGKFQSSIDIQIDGRVQKPKPGEDPHKFGAIMNSAHQQVGQMSVDLHRSDDPPRQGKTGRYRVLIVMAPTEPEDPRLPRADAGRWTVMIRKGHNLLKGKPIHCWIQRSSDPESLRSGSRQSYFDEWAYEKTRFTAEGDLSEEDTERAFVQRFGSLNGLATGRTALVVGGYRLSPSFGSSLASARPARYSSAGVLQPDGADQEACVPPCPCERTDVSAWPDKQVNASSMSERSRVLPGTIAAGVRSGSLSLVRGTSSAAPFVARQLAERFVEASDAEVDSAARENYSPLLHGYWSKDPYPTQASDTLTPRAAPASRYAQDNSLTQARLGKVRVAPHWQPGVELTQVTKPSSQDA